MTRMTLSLLSWRGGCGVSKADDVAAKPRIPGLAGGLDCKGPAPGSSSEVRALLHREFQQFRAIPSSQQKGRTG
jgi:hypothetical protein